MKRIPATEKYKYPEVFIEKNYIHIYLVRSYQSSLSQHVSIYLVLLRINVEVRMTYFISSHCSLGITHIIATDFAFPRDKKEKN